MNVGLMRDERLSWKDKALMFILAVTFHGWFSFQDVMKKVTNPKLVVRGHLGKLLKYGYVKKAGNKYTVPVEYLITGK